MGGRGSGAWQSYSAKETVEECLTLDLSTIGLGSLITWEACASGKLQVGRGSWMNYTLANNVLELTYTFKTGPSAGQPVRCLIAICATQPHFGGRRLWWECPQCERRCRKLYLASGEKTYRCRVCADLTYLSTRRLHRQIIQERVRQLLGETTRRTLETLL
jgi:hypothetical protein